MLAWESCQRSDWRTFRGRLFLGMFALALLFLSGCTRGNESNEGLRPPAAETGSTLPASPDEVAGFTREELSSIAAYLPILDDDRLQVAPPIRWYTLPRSKDYVVRFVRDHRQQTPLPRITLEARDVSFEGIGTLSRANLLKFRRLVADRLEERTRQALEEDVQPLMLGEVPCVHFVVKKEYQVGHAPDSRFL